MTPIHVEKGHQRIPGFRRPIHIRITAATDPHQQQDHCQQNGSWHMPPEKNTTLADSY